MMDVYKEQLHEALDGEPEEQEPAERDDSSGECACGHVWDEHHRQECQVEGCPCFYFEAV